MLTEGQRQYAIACTDTYIYALQIAMLTIKLRAQNMGGGLIIYIIA